MLLDITSFVVGAAVGVLFHAAITHWLTVARDKIKARLDA